MASATESRQQQQGKNMGSPMFPSATIIATFGASGAAPDPDPDPDADATIHTVAPSSDDVIKVDPDQGAFQEEDEEDTPDAPAETGESHENDDMAAPELASRRTSLFDDDARQPDGRSFAPVALREDRISPPWSSVISSPPYWAMLPSADESGHHPARGVPVSNVALIQMRDNEREDGEGEGEEGEEEGTGPSKPMGSGDGTAAVATSSGRDRNRACWAKGVDVSGYVLVNGSTTNIGAFVVWNIRVQTLSGSHMNIRKRYSQFDEFRKHLVQSFPNFEAAVPDLPPKSLIYKFQPHFLERRRKGLQYFLNCILLNPEFSGSPILKDFLFA